MRPFLRPYPLVPAALLLVFCLGGCGEKKAAGPPPPPDVQVVTVEQKDVPVYSEWVATLDGYINAQIRPQVSGYLIKRSYEEGTLVRKGQVLFVIDPRPFQAALEQVQAQELEAQARLTKTTLDVERDTPLAREKAIPQAQLDNDIQAQAAAKAGVEAAKAMVEQAQLNLGFTQVRSLVDGVAGLAQGQIGDLVGPSTVLTSVSQVDPIKAYLSVSEQEYLRAAPRISAYLAGKEMVNQNDKILELILGDGSTFAQKGWWLLADRQVDPKTGTVRMAGAFLNPGNILRPGQFGRVRTVTQVAKGVALVPQRAVTEIQGSYQVAVVGADKKVSIRPVKVGDRVGSMWIISEGLKPGEQVIAEGIQKVKAGMLVNPKPFTATAEGM